MKVLSWKGLSALLFATLVLGACGGDDSTPSEQRDAGSDTEQPDSGDSALELERFEPTSGPADGGTIVTLTGRGFEEGLNVRFGQTSASDVEVLSETEATAVTPSGSAGAVTVSVTLPGGATSSLLNAFTYVDSDAPRVSFCQLDDQGTLAAVTGEASEPVRAQVFAEGVTVGQGQGEGIEGELGWGTGADVSQYTFNSMDYEGDRDGLSESDASNDVYSARLTIPTQGDFRYVARFKAESRPDWVYCDLDSNENGVAEDQLGRIEVQDPATPQIGFCQTETPSSLVLTGEASEELFGQVFVAGATPGAGQGSGVEAEVVWGDADQPVSSWSNTQTAVYREDADGLNPGDLANDRYVATLTAASEGDYGYAFRFSADGGASWTLCDTDGTSEAQPFDDSRTGLLEVRDDIQVLPDACNLQFPELVPSLVVGESLTIFGRVTRAGLTGNATESSEIEGEIWVGPVTSNPQTDPSDFTVLSATLRTNDLVGVGPDEDEYEATWTPTDPGSYQYFVRFSADSGANFVSCDLDGNDANSDFDLDRVGFVRVFASGDEPDLVDYCHVFQDTLAISVSDPAPVITAEVFEAGVTEVANSPTGAEFEAEAGYGARGANPGIPGTFTWNSISYKGVGPSNPNNLEYEGGVYPDAMQPLPGMYDVAVRVRLASTQPWQYCDASDNSMDFFTGETSTLNLSN